MKKLKVLLVDDEIMIREGFKRLFDTVVAVVKGGMAHILNNAYFKFFARFVGIGFVFSSAG